MCKEVIIIGAGGHGKVIADIILKSGDQIKGFLDDSFPDRTSFIGYPILGKVNSCKDIKGAAFITAIGNADLRKNIATEYREIEWYTAIHPSAVISDIDVFVGSGTAIMANAIINPGTHIGEHCIINSGAIVEHDNHISDYVHVSVGAKLAGTVSVGAKTWVGIGAAISNNLSVCGDCTIGAGAVVVKNIENPGIYIGIPAKEKKNNEKKCMDF